MDHLLRPKLLHPKLLFVRRGISHVFQVLLPNVWCNGRIQAYPATQEPEKEEQQSDRNYATDHSPGDRPDRRR